MAISCLGFNTIALFSRQIFKIDDDAPLLILICGDDLFSPSKLSHGRLPKYLIDGRTFWANRNDPYDGVWTDSKKGPVRADGFSSRSLPSLLAVSLPSRVYYLARPTKTAMLGRLSISLTARFHKAMKPIVYADYGSWKMCMNTTVAQIDRMFSFTYGNINLVWNRTAQPNANNPHAESLLFHPSWTWSSILV